MMVDKADRTLPSTRVVELRLLGRFEVVADGGLLTPSWHNRRARELVQLLALAPRHALPRDQVIDALWPHLDADAGAANLRKAAHHARRALGEASSVELQQGIVALFPRRSITSDVGRFEAAADAALAADDRAQARVAARQYAGELLPLARYETWADDARRRLHDKYLAVLRLAEHWTELLDRDPTDQAACRQLMREAIAAGQRHRAISCYGRLRRALLHDIGITPDAETEALYLSCVEDLGPDHPGFVGRAAELAMIERVLLGRNRREVVWLRGSPGTGKTALCAVIGERAAAAGRLVVAPPAPDDGRSYGLVAVLVERLIADDPERLVSLSPKARAVLAVITPAAGPAEPLDLPVTRHQVVGAVQKLLEASGSSGAVLVIDDAHLVDEASLATAAQLGDRLGCALVLVFASRPGGADDAVRRAVVRAARDRPPLVCELAGLARDEVQALALAMGGPLDETDLDVLMTRSEGVPFLVVELLKGGPPFHETRARRPLNEAIAQRLAVLPVDVLAWLRRLAIVGGPLDLQRVLALVGCHEDDAVRLLDTALVSGVLEIADGTYRFRHDLVREALADDVPPHHRVAIHRDAARRLVELGAPPAVIARHWQHGGRPDDAADWFIRAARDELRVGGYRGVVELAEAALAHRPDDIDALLCRARAFDALGDPRALGAYAHAEAVGGDELRNEIAPLRALAQIKQGDPAGALRALDGASPRGIEARLSQALTWAGAALLGAAGPDQGSLLSAEGRRLAFESGDPASVIVASWAQAAAAHARGALRDSLWADLRETAALRSLAVTVFDGQLCITQRLLYGDRPYDDVIRFADSFEREALRLGAARGTAFARTLRGEAELLSGRLDEADADLREALRLHRSMGAATGTAFTLQRRAELALQRGDLTEANCLLDDALAIARESDVGFHLFDRIYGTKILVALEAGDPRAAALAVEGEESVQGPFETCPGCRITLAVPAAIAAARSGDTARFELLEQQCEFLAHTVMHLPAWDAALDEVRGWGARARGADVDARRHFSTAAATFAAVGQPLDAQRCRQLAADGRP